MQGGISTPAEHKVVLLFTGETGSRFSSNDGWTVDGIYLYTGGGQEGDMTFKAGNKAIRDHLPDGKDLLLLSYPKGAKSGLVGFDGQMACIGHRLEGGPDINGHRRNAIVFELARATDVDIPVPTTGPAILDPPAQRERAIQTVSVDLPTKQRIASYRQRSADTKLYTQARSNGVCEGSEAPAPLITSDGRPYLEVHHIRRLSDAGPDDPLWVAAVCPSCHRRAHYAEDTFPFNNTLEAQIRARELAYGLRRASQCPCPDRRLACEPR